MEEREVLRLFRKALEQFYKSIFPHVGNRIDKNVIVIIYDIKSLKIDYSVHDGHYNDQSIKVLEAMIKRLRAH